MLQRMEAESTVGSTFPAAELGWDAGYQHRVVRHKVFNVVSFFLLIYV
jgi:hypothetical protein